MAARGGIRGSDNNGIEPRLSSKKERKVIGASETRSIVRVEILKTLSAAVTMPGLFRFFENERVEQGYLLKTDFALGQ